MNQPSTVLKWGALNGALAICAGAFGAHALRGVLPDASMSAFKTGAEYHLVHSLALLCQGIILHLSLNLPKVKKSKDKFSRKFIRPTLPGWFFLLGITLFSGSLYALALTGIRALGMITPFGGVSFILGWLTLALNANALPTHRNKPMEDC